MKNCSIYCIRNVVSDRCYVGSSVDMKARINRHFNHLRKGIHYNQKLQRSFDRHGEWAFEVTKVDECFVSERAEVETAWIKRLKAVEKGFNICHEGMRIRGTPQSPEHVAKRAAAALGRKHSEETRAKLSAAAKIRGADHLHTPEVRARAGLKLVGRPLSDEHRAKLSAAALARPKRKYGKRPATEKQLAHLQRLAASRKGKKVA